MTCCSRYAAAEKQFGHKRAERDLRHYRRRGPDAITRALLVELRRWPLQGRRLLDIGGGIGVIGLELQQSGVAGVTLVEASPAYLEVAEREFEAKEASHPTQFALGDFAALADTLPGAEIVTLHRVVCCYPDAETLVKAAAARARQLLALTYPRDRWYMRAAFGLINLGLRFGGTAFRVFVHSPQRMARVCETAGLVRAARRETRVWSIDLYRRPDVA